MRSAALDAREPAAAEPVLDGRANRLGIDGVTLLTIYVVLLFAVPSRLVFAPLGGAGTPALIVGCAGAAFWLWYHLHRSQPFPPASTRVRWSLGAFVATVLASYAAAMYRPIVAAEVSTADLGLILLVGWVGVALVAHDGISDITRFETLVGRLTVAGGAVAILGILQFLTRQPLIDHVEFPGLTTNASLDSVLGRSGFARPAGTAIHPIEFGVMLTVVLPFALHRGLYYDHLNRLRRWWPTLAIAGAIPLSISRSALVGSAVVLLVLLPTWPSARRWASLALIGALFGVIFLTIPGMLRTLTTMFTGIGGDSSARSRTDSYGLALEFVARNPVVGRGWSTFLPAYRILDNQYLGALVEVGVLGLSALLALILTAFLSARRARTLTTDPSQRDLAQATAAGIASAAVSLAFFDGFGFPMASGLFFLVIGMSGALGRVLGHRQAVAR